MGCCAFSHEISFVQNVFLGYGFLYGAENNHAGDLIKHQYKTFKSVLRTLVLS